MAHPLCRLHRSHSVSARDSSVRPVGHRLFCGLSIESGVLLAKKLWAPLSITSYLNAFASPLASGRTIFVYLDPVSYCRERETVRLTEKEKFFAYLSVVAGSPQTSRTFHKSLAMIRCEFALRMCKISSISGPLRSYIYLLRLCLDVQSRRKAAMGGYRKLVAQSFIAFHLKFNPNFIVLR